jgi:large subunit ribosomal protein L21
MEYAIVEASGKQHWIEIGKFIDLNKLGMKLGTKVRIRRILAGRNGEKMIIGSPYLLNPVIEGIIGRHFLAPKVIVYKMKPKKKYRRKNGHRQSLSRLLISKI